MKRRRPNQLRAVRIERVDAGAPAGVVITQGRTRVLCTASVSDEVPGWLRESNPPSGWVTAEYSMLPGSTPDRGRRGPSSRGTEIQRLIGRALRASVRLEKMPGVTITCDCDVLVADGGTRTASITGGYVAVAMAMAWARKKGLIEGDPLIGPVAAVSVGLLEARAWLDLDYEMDVKAEVDLNVVMNHRGRFVEIQGTGEHGTFDRPQLDRMLRLASGGVRKLVAYQRRALVGVK